MLKKVRMEKSNAVTLPKEEEAKKEVKKEVKSKKSLYKPKPTWNAFLNEWQTKNREGNMNENKHHPDAHFLGADDTQCPGCDKKSPSAKHIYDNM